MLGLGTSLASIDSHVIHKELSELDNYTDLDIWFDFSRTLGNQGDTVTAVTNLGYIGAGGGTRSFIDSTCDLNDTTTVRMDDTSGVAVGMLVVGDSVNSTVASITDATSIVLADATAAGTVSNVALTFTSAADSYDLSQETGTPSLNIGYNTTNKRSVSFDGGNDVLVTKAVYTTAGKPMTILLVCHNENISGGNDYVIANAGDDEDIAHIRFRDGGGSVQCKWNAEKSTVTTPTNNTSGTTSSYTMANDTNMAVVFRRDSDGKLYMYADDVGIIAKKSNTNNDTPANFVFGAIGGTSETTADYEGFIGEFALYDVDLGEAKILTMLEEMCKKWDINQ